MPALFFALGFAAVCHDWLLQKPPCGGGTAPGAGAAGPVCPVTPPAGIPPKGGAPNGEAPGTRPGAPPTPGVLGGADIVAARLCSCAESGGATGAHASDAIDAATTFGSTPASRREHDVRIASRIAAISGPRSEAFSCASSVVRRMHCSATYHSCSGFARVCGVCGFGGGACCAISDPSVAVKRSPKRKGPDTPA